MNYPGAIAGRARQETPIDDAIAKINRLQLRIQDFTNRVRDVADLVSGSLGPMNTASNAASPVPTLPPVTLLGAIASLEDALTNLEGEGNRVLP